MADSYKLLPEDQDKDKDRFGLTYNERILIGIVIIASIVFFVVPSILIGVLLQTGYIYGPVIGAPFPIIILFVGLYLLWRVKANRKARRQFSEMREAAQPVINDHELFRSPAVGSRGADHEILPTVTSPLDGNLVQVANLGQSEKENEKTNKTAEVYQIVNESERITKEQ